MLFEAKPSASPPLSADVYLALGHNVDLITLDHSLVGRKHHFFELFTNFVLHIVRPVADKEETCLYDIEVIRMVDF